MCLFLEILWVKKCPNLSGVGREYFPITLNIFYMPKIWNDFFYSTALVDKIIRGNITNYSFYQLVFDMEKYLPQNHFRRQTLVFPILTTSR